MNIIVTLMHISALLLIIAYVMSLFASYYWVLDIFSHFAFQYVLCGLALCVLYLCFKDWSFAVVMLVLAFLNIYEIRTSYSDPWQFSPPHQEKPNLTIVHFNKFYRSQNWEEFGEWLKENAPKTDVMMVQESGIDTIYRLQKFKEYFPYQYPENHRERVNDISVLSHIPLQIEEIKALKGKEAHTSGARIIYQRKDMPQPVHIYSIHAHKPVSQADHIQRDEDLFIMKEAIKNDPHPYKTFSGDWNLSPYSPIFQDVLKETGLKYNDYSLLPKPTWPSFTNTSLLQIPIDHILYSPDMKQINKKVGPHIGSDHHMLIAKFYIPES